MKLVKIPIEAKQVVIGQKPRRGRPCKSKKALEYQSEADKEERVVSSIKVLKRKITEVEEETPQETEAEKVVQASTSSDLSKKRYFNDRLSGKGKIVEIDESHYAKVNHSKGTFQSYPHMETITIKESVFFTTDSDHEENCESDFEEVGVAICKLIYTNDKQTKNKKQIMRNYMK
ncbi:hypothetical protein BpHYR1_041721 [Brachionus plicatilis]|uniref:Uncharacterized protein n=1 Tax=Brachionus plicatilis TaxID=10195 RepID=A0A3M7RC82_BRAPC|nr:hypothetical protein BpHYR1_041721 [Brachionus plicatilis]